MAFPLPADLPTRAERAAWPPPTAGTTQPGPAVEDRPARPGRRVRVSSPAPAPDQPVDEVPTPDQQVVEPTAPRQPAATVTPPSETIAVDLDAPSDVDLDEHDIALPRLPRSGEHRAHPLPVALRDDAFEPDVDPTARSPEPAFSAPGADPEAEATSAPRPAQESGSDVVASPGAGSEPSWRSVLAQRPEPARPLRDLAEPNSLGRDSLERDASESGDTGAATARTVDADLPQDLRPKGLRRAEKTDEDGSQTVTDIRRQAARPPARPQPIPREPVDPAQRAGRRSADPHQMGMPAFVAVLVGVGGSLLGAFLDILVTGGVGLLFSLCFVLTAFGVAAGVRPTGLFTAGVLPPLAALTSLVVVAAVNPQRIATTASPVRAVLVGLAWESWTIVAGCAVALVTIAVRAAFAHRARVSASRRSAEAYAARGAGRRSGSPRRS